MTRSWTKGVLGLAVFAAVTLVGVRAEAAYFNVFDGCLTGSTNTVDCNGSRAGLADGTLTTSPEWDENYLAWTVDFDFDTSLWKYTYNFVDGTPGSQNTSHSLLELSASFTAANVKDGSTCGGGAITTYSDNDNGNSNPFLPGSIYGIKCNGTQLNPFTVVLVTDRAPVWGDWYAKDGNPVHGYNTGFLVADPTDAARDGSVLNHVLAPDSVNINPNCTVPADCDVTVPEPVSLALFGLALTAAGIVKRRQRNS